MSLKNITLRILGQSETPEQELQIAGGEGVAASRFRNRNMVDFLLQKQPTL